MSGFCVFIYFYSSARLNKYKWWGTNSVRLFVPQVVADRFTDRPGHHFLRQTSTSFTHSLVNWRLPTIESRRCSRCGR